MTEHRPAVCVVVPVYATGPYIRPLLDALDAQEQPAGGLEVIFADDGSPDSTPALLESWAAARPWARVLRLENSGWPSHPRNVAVDRTDAEFVFFVDHDDWLGHDALRRMTDFARECSADVVIGRMVGVGRKVPSRLFRRTSPDARPPEVPLEDSMTVHCMFRTDFLRETGLGFDESLRRLEDHVFMATAYTRAARIAVLAEGDVYFHSSRHDGGNAAYRPYAPDEYYAALRRAIEIVVASAASHAERNAYLDRWVRQEMLSRLRSVVVRSLPEQQRTAFFSEVQTLLRTAIPDGVIPALPTDHRWWAALAREAEPEEFWRAADVVDLTLRRGLAGRPATRVLADAVSPATLDAAVRVAGTDPELTSRGARSALDLVRRRLRLATARAISAVGSRRLHDVLTSWAREPEVLVRATAAWAGLAAAVMSAILAATSSAAGAAAMLALAAVAVTVWLARQETSGLRTAARQAVALAPAIVVAVRDLDAPTAAAAVAGLAAIAVAAALDRRWRRSEVRGYPGRRLRIGWIGLGAIGVGAVVAAVDLWALLGR